MNSQSQYYENIYELRVFKNMSKKFLQSIPVYLDANELAKNKDFISKCLKSTNNNKIDQFLDLIHKNKFNKYNFQHLNLFFEVIRYVS